MLTPEFRADFVALLEPATSKKFGTTSYSVTMIFDREEDVKAMVDEIEAVIAKQFPGGKNRPAYVPSPIRKGVQVSAQNPNGFELDKYPQYAGKWVLKANRSLDQGAPGVVNAQAQPIMDAAEVYSGMYGRASVDFYWNKHKNQVFAALNNFQKTRDGEKLGRVTPKAEQEFGVFVAPDAPAGSADNSELLGV